MPRETCAVHKPTICPAPLIKLRGKHPMEYHVHFERRSTQIGQLSRIPNKAGGSHSKVSWHSSRQSPGYARASLELLADRSCGAHANVQPTDVILPAHLLITRL